MSSPDDSPSDSPKINIQGQPIDSNNIKTRFLALAEDIYHNPRKYVYLVIPSLLFCLGLPAAGLSGFSGIPIFLKSMSAIQGMAFLNSLPFFVTAIPAIILGYYTIFVEQVVFYPHTQKLYRQALNKIENLFRKLLNLKEIESEDKTFHEQALDIKQQIDEIDRELEALIKKYNLTDDFSDIIKPAKDISRRKKPDSILRKYLKYLHLITAHSIAITVVGLRALVSIGSSMLGLQIFSLAVLSLFGITMLPVWTIPLFATLSAFKYFNNNSQQQINQYNKTLVSCGIERYLKSDLKILNNELELKNKILYKFNIAAVNKEEILRQKLLKLKNNFKHENSISNIFTKAFIKNAIIFSIFILGGLGLSTQAFFSILKFFKEMSTVPTFSFLAKVPIEVYYGACAAVSCYIFNCEVMVLKDYFTDLSNRIINNVANCFYSILGYTSDSSNSFNKTVNLSEFKITKEEAIVILASIRQKPEYYQIDSQNQLIFTNENIYKIFKNKLSIKRLNQSELFSKNKYSVELRELTLNPDTSRNSWFKEACKNSWYNFARGGSITVLIIRAITSIGPSNKGLTALINILLKKTGQPEVAQSLNGITLPVCTTGYTIKCSQNVDSHYATNMENMFFTDVYKSDDELLEEYALLTEKAYAQGFRKYNYYKSQELNPQSPIIGSDNHTSSSKKHCGPMYQQACGQAKTTTTQGTQKTQTPPYFAF